MEKEKNDFAFKDSNTLDTLYYTYFWFGFIYYVSILTFYKTEKLATEMGVTTSPWKKKRVLLLLKILKERIIFI